MISKSHTSPLPMDADGLWIESPAESEKVFLASIFDLRGRWLASHTFYVEDDRNKCYWHVDHTHWPQGIYLLVLRGERMLRQVKLVK